MITKLDTDEFLDLWWYMKAKAIYHHSHHIYTHKRDILIERKERGEMR